MIVLCNNSAFIFKNTHQFMNKHIVRGNDAVFAVGKTNKYTYCK